MTQATGGVKLTRAAKPPYFRPPDDNRTFHTEYEIMVSRIGRTLLKERPTRPSYQDRIDAGTMLQNVDLRDLDLSVKKWKI